MKQVEALSLHSSCDEDGEPDEAGWEVRVAVEVAVEVGQRKNLWGEIDSLVGKTKKTEEEGRWLEARRRSQIEAEDGSRNG